MEQPYPGFGPAGICGIPSLTSPRSPNDTMADLQLAYYPRRRKTAKKALFTRRKRAFWPHRGPPECRARASFQRIEKKLEKGVDGNQFARIMRGSLRDTVYFSRPPKDTCRRTRIVAKTSFACIMVGPSEIGDSYLNCSTAPEYGAGQLR